MSTPLFTKPARSRLSAHAAAPRQPASMAKGKTRDVDQAFDAFRLRRLKVPVIARNDSRAADCR